MEGSEIMRKSEKTLMNIIILFIIMLIKIVPSSSKLGIPFILCKFIVLKSQIIGDVI